MSSSNYTDLTTTLLWKNYKKTHSEHPSMVFKMWLVSIGMGLLLYGFFLCYVYVQIQTFNLTTMNRALVGVAAIMFGLSFALGGLGHYIKPLSSKVAYRKYIGLVGYFAALSYSISLLFVNPKKYFYGFFDNLLTPDFILGLTAMTIFTGMALISNNKAMKLLGLQRWRWGLRLGYLAYFLLIVRATILDHKLWSTWIQQPEGLPPLRLVLSLYAATVLLFRLFLAISPRRST